MKRFTKALTALLAVTGLLVGPQFASAALAVVTPYPACTIQGTAAAETLTGTAGNDVICTGGGDDTVNALGGDDIVLVQVDGIVTADLGAGNDTFDGSLADGVEVDGGAGDDHIIGSDFDDTLSGGAGVDPDTDTIDAGMGNDTITGERLETLIVNLGPGNDVFDGGQAIDTEVYGGDGDDNLTGSAGDDLLYGDGGADTIYGAAGDDALIGGAGIDDITGGNGNDNLEGSAGNDELNGDAGEDTLNGGDGVDDLQGGDGNDTLIGGEAADVLSGGPGADNLSGNAGADTLYGEAGEDSLDGGVGGDIIAGGEGYDVLDGGAGEYHLNYCDYAITEPSTTTCIYDDNGPTFPSVNVSPNAVDVGTTAQTFNVSGTINDITGVRDFRLSCGPLTMIWYGGTYTHLFDGHTWSTSTDNTFTKVDKDLNFRIAMKADVGVKPGNYTCSGYATDVLNQIGSLPGNAGALDIQILRTGTFDDEGPAFGTTQLYTHIVDSSVEDKYFRVSGSVTDATGIARVRMDCGPAYFIYYSGPTAWRFDGVDGYNTADRSTITRSTDGKSITFDLYLRIPYGTLPGTWNCTLEAVDTLNNYSYAAPAGLDFEVTRFGPGRDANNDGQPDGFDDLGPTVDSISISKHIVDVGAFHDNFVVTGKVSDPAGIRAIRVECGPSMFYWQQGNSVYRHDGHNFSYTLTDVTFSEQNTYTEFVVNLSVAYGSLPSTGFCQVTTTDRLNHVSYHNGSTLGLDFQVLRTPAGQPNAPTGIRYTADNPTAGVLEWFAPSRMGDPELKDYQIEYSFDKVNWKRIKDGFTTAVRLPISNLLSATNYWFRVRGENGGGAGTWSEPTLIRTPNPYAPDAPTNLVLSGLTPNRIVMDWVTPRYNGGAAITDYIIEASTDAGVTWRAVEKANPSNSSHFTIYGLAPGTDYLVRLAAKNIVGLSDRLQGSFTTPKTVPTAPTELVANDVTLTTLNLTWAVPSSNGGDPITDYAVEVSSNNGSSWTAIPHTASAVRNFNVNGLLAGRTYLFRVAALNSYGAGAYSEVTRVTMGITVPGAPSNLAVSSVAANTATLVWNLPTENGGSLITDYVVELSKDNGATWNPANHIASANPRLNLTGLTPGANYQVRVAAKNNAGISGYATASFSTPVRVSGAPAVVNARDISDTALTLAWTLPASNGGSPITDYVIQVSSNAGLTWTAIPHAPSNKLAFAVTGLKAGTAYLFRVSAVNAVGNGVWSPAARAVTLGSAPNAPTGLTVPSKTTSTITLRWAKATVVGGSAVRSYVLEYAKNGSRTWYKVSAPNVKTTSLVIGGLKRATEYVFRVRAVNDVGTSVPSKTFKVKTK